MGARDSAVKVEELSPVINILMEGEGSLLSGTGVLNRFHKQLPAPLVSICLSLGSVWFIGFAEDNEYLLSNRLNLLVLLLITSVTAGEGKQEESR